MVFEESAVVEPVDPFECCEFELIESAPRSLVADAFGLVEPVDRFRERVVIRSAARSDRVHDAVLGEAFGVANREILHSPVAVMREIGEIQTRALPRPDRLFESVERKIGPQRS